VSDTFKEILKRLSQATPGTWSIEPHGVCPECEGTGRVVHGQAGSYPCGNCSQTGHTWTLYSDRLPGLHGLNLVTLSSWDSNMAANMALIASARQDLSFLVKTVLDLERRIRELESGEA
jgi:hypothetical protein